MVNFALNGPIFKILNRSSQKIIIFRTVSRLVAFLFHAGQWEVFFLVSIQHLDLQVLFDYEYYVLWLRIDIGRG